MTFLTFELGCKLYKTENVESSPVQKKIIYLQSLSDYLWPHKSKLCHWKLRFIAFSGSFGLKTDLSRRIFIGLPGKIIIDHTFRVWPFGLDFVQTYEIHCITYVWKQKVLNQECNKKSLPVMDSSLNIFVKSVTFWTWQHTLLKSSLENILEGAFWLKFQFN